MMKAGNLVSRVVLFFWSVWFTLVLASNLVDGLQQAGVAPAGWAFSSGNFALIVETISIYAWPTFIAVILFVGVLVVELLAAVAFWRAAVDPAESAGASAAKIDLSFSLAIGLFAGFLIADELFIVYDRIGSLETSHFTVLCALLLSFLIIGWLPERRET